MTGDPLCDKMQMSYQLEDQVRVMRTEDQSGISWCRDWFPVTEDWGQHDSIGMQIKIKCYNISTLFTTILHACNIMQRCARIRFLRLTSFSVSGNGYFTFGSCRVFGNLLCFRLPSEPPGFRTKNSIVITSIEIPTNTGNVCTNSTLC